MLTFLFKNHFLSVSPLVPFSICRRNKPHTTNITLVRSLSSMRSHVGHQLRLGFIGLFADIAAERFHIYMPYFVSVQKTYDGKGLRTIGTFINAFLVKITIMSGEGDIIFEHFPTQFAEEQSACMVSASFVNLKRWFLCSIMRPPGRPKKR